MRIDALTVCWRYSDYLRKGIENWKRGLDSLTVVTTPEDADTLRLCESWDVKVFTTNAFFDDGAKFNKGKAMSLAFDAGTWPDWVLFFDADIVPPPTWREEAEAANPQIGCLHGASRVLEEGWQLHDGELAGWFNLFHSTDPNAQVRPIVDTHWSHAGCYDSYFARRWFRDEQVILPIQMTHQGLPGQNWCGRGNDEAMTELLQERANRGGHQHERIDQ